MTFDLSSSSIHLVICGVGSGMEKDLIGVIDIIGPNSILTVITDSDPNIESSARVLKAYPRSWESVSQVVAESPLAKESIDGVLTLGYENVPVVSKLASALGCPGLKLEVAERCTHKEKRIIALQKAGISVPRFQIIRNSKELQTAYTLLGFPFILKPNDKTSSIGVQIVSDPSYALIQFEDARKHSSSGIVIAEEYILGTEHTFEGITSDGQVFFTGISDRDYSQKNRFHPFVFEQGDILPSSLSDEKIRQVKDEIEKSLVALELENSAFHCDILITADGRIFILEVAGRISGSRFGTELVPLSGGPSILVGLIKTALKIPVTKDDFPQDKENRAVVTRSFPCEGGVVSVVHDISKIKHELDFLHDLYWERLVSVGEALPAYRSAKDVLATAVVTANTVECALKNATSLDAFPLVELTT